MSDDRFVVHNNVPNPDIPEDAALLAFKGLQISDSLLSAEEWAAFGFTGPPQPLVYVTIDTQVIGEPLTAVLPGVVFDVGAAALMIAALTTRFAEHGLGPALTAEIDQVRATAREAE